MQEGLTDTPTEAQVKARLMTIVPTLEPLTDYGDLMTVADWLGGVRSLFFTDYDGHGYYATKDGRMKDRVVPSDIMRKGMTPPGWATHVEWFNR